MDIIVTLKQVPDPEAPKESFRIDDVAMKILNPASVDPVINGFDENAIEAALQIREAVGGNRTAMTVLHIAETRFVVSPDSDRSPNDQPREAIFVACLLDRTFAGRSDRTRPFAAG